jgi:hypothetical protein
MIIKKELVDSVFAQFGESDITQLSIREVGKLVAKIEEVSGEEFIHMEMGVPGLPASSIGVAAEKVALDLGLANSYPNIEGIQSVNNSNEQVNDTNSNIPNNNSSSNLININTATKEDLDTVIEKLKGILSLLTKSI